MASQSQPILPSNGQSEAEPAAALKPSEVLERAAALIEPEGAWTQGRYGERDYDDPASPYTCLCVYGAIGQLSEARGHEFAWSAFDYLETVVGGTNPIDWNDAKGRTQPEVVAALRKAAELARSEGQ